MPTFELEILTPVKMVYRGTVESLQAPGSEGGFGVLSGHQPMLAALNPGQIVCRGPEGSRQVATSGGFAEVQPNRVVVLAETAELSDEIDVVRAGEARDRARERLAKGRDSEIDRARAEAALTRALNRLKVAG
ncbi:MAG: F0F1 ATP synthase subunit epsilon, partial [bacterium]|nr:F0F1 ATP synthase subunit epsilon [bacterium]